MNFVMRGELSWPILQQTKRCLELLSVMSAANGYNIMKEEVDSGLSQIQCFEQEVETLSNFQPVTMTSKTEDILDVTLVKDRHRLHVYGELVREGLYYAGLFHIVSL